MAVEHYENFPVASFLLPKQLRPAVKTIYAFARSADDIADEGDAPPEKRLEQLQIYEDELDKIDKKIPSQSNLFIALRATIEQYDLPVQAFRDLLSAFKQDVHTLQYADYDALQNYCHRSADPVGCLMLHLYGAVNPENLKQSNAICTALQLINFWQDIAIDWKKQRVYVPQTDLTDFSISIDHIRTNRADSAWQAMMRFQTERARTLMLSGSPLAKKLPGRIGWELRLVIQGGLRILECIDQNQGDIFRKRPKLGLSDWPLLLWRAIWM